MKKPTKELLGIYEALYECFGPQHWWPGETLSEIIIGAVLAQNTSWSNVEKAILRLKTEGVLSLATLQIISEKKLADFIRPSGYFNQKAKKLKNLVYAIDVYLENNIKKISIMPLPEARDFLLSINGIGPETADSILLYAFNFPTFVIDAYTMRVFYRVGYFGKNFTYNDAKAFFENNLPKDPKLFNEYHALLIRLGKEICKSHAPSCSECPIEKFCSKKMS